MKTIVLFSLLLMLTACATAVNVDYQPGTNFAFFKSFRIEEKPLAMPDDPRINSPFTQQRIAEALKSQLVQKGMSASDDKPDMVVKYHLGLKQEVESDASGVSFGIGSTSPHTSFGMIFGSGADVATHDNLTITIDLFKAGTDKLIWRGSFESRLAEGSTPESSTKLINAMVKQIIDKFPPE